MKPALTLIGTGLSGMTAALAFAHQGIDVTLVGPAPSDTKDERTTAILLPGIQLLRDLGLWDLCEKTATPLNTMELRDADQVAVFDAAKIGQMSFGYNISNHVLKTQLVAALKKHRHVTWHETTVKDMRRLSSGSWQIDLADKKKKLTAHLVIGADGRNSVVRQTAGIGIDTIAEKQVAAVTVVTTEHPHFNTSVEWYTKGGPLTLVPMPGKKLAVVWCEDKDVHEETRALDRKQIGHLLTEKTEQRFGRLQVIEALQFWPIHPLKAHALVGPGVALLGEAAHVLPPIGAQGFNTSLQDIIALRTAFAKAMARGLKLHDPTTLSTYESQRLKNIVFSYRAMTGLNTMIRAQQFLPTFFRQFGLRTISRMPLLKRWIMTNGLESFAA